MSHPRDVLPEPPSTDLWVRFVNTETFTRGRATDHIAQGDALVAWLRGERLLSDRAAGAERAQLRDDPDDAGRRLDDYRALRDLIRAMAVELTTTGELQRGQVRDLNHILRRGLHYHQLETSTDGNQYALARVGDRLDQARATVAGTFAEYLAGRDLRRLRICANDGCREIFIDRSPTGRRRWCTMRTCGNRAKVARHRERHRGEVVVHAPETVATLPAGAIAH